MNILNLYVGIGGNRKLWSDEHQITAVELDPEIAAIYVDLYPNDELVIGDAHEYLLENYYKFDFIWSSPPCQSHSSFRQNIGVRFRGVKAVYPDMKLYQEILFLQANFKGKWLVENVKPYYQPLINPSAVLYRHLFWTNYKLNPIEFGKSNHRTAQIPELQLLHGIDLSKYKISNKRQILRNCVIPELGKYALNQSIQND